MFAWVLRKSKYLIDSHLIDSYNSEYASFLKQVNEWIDKSKCAFQPILPAVKREYVRDHIVIFVINKFLQEFVIYPCLRFNRMT